MPTTSSNLLSNPYSSALNSKKSVSPFQSLSQKPLNFKSLTPSYTAPKPAGSVSGSNLSGAVNNLNIATAKAKENPLATKVASAQTLPSQPIQQPVQQPAQNAPLDSDTYKNLLMTNIQSQIADKQNQLKAEQEREASMATEEVKQPVGGLFGSLLGKGQEKLSEAALLKAKMDRTQQEIMNNPNYSLDVAEGRGGLVNQQYGTQLQALQGIGQSYLDAAGQAKPQVASFGQTVFDPAKGEFTGGGTGGDINSAVQNVVQRLQNGTMSYSQAQEALAPYGSGGQIALQNSLPKDFNIAQSETLAGQQGSIGPALSYAKLALNHAKETLGGLQIPGQTSNIGLLSDISNWFSDKSGVGKEATRTKQGALAEARSAIQAVLASVRGGNPTEYRDQSYALLPDNATPADIDAAMANLDTLGEGKQNIYGNPGQSGQTTSSQYDW